MSRKLLVATLWCSLSLLFVLGGCATNKEKFDYTAYRKSDPKSILILPPVNNSPDVGASGSVLSTATTPIAEDGYYVYPVALVARMFKENGLTVPEDIHQVPIEKLHEIFGADAALYIDIDSYGSSYRVVESEARVSLMGKLVDLRTGEVIWVGHASASTAEQRNNNGQGGLMGMLISAVIHQVANNLTDRSHDLGAIANIRMLSANSTDGLLYGPRSPNYKKP